MIGTTTARRSEATPTMSGIPEDSLRDPLTDPTVAKPGGLKLVTAASASESAMDGQFTPKLLAALSESDDMSLDCAIESATTDALALSVRVEKSKPTDVATMRSQSPVAASDGDTDDEGPGLGVYVANSEYDTLADLKGTPGEATAMASAMGGEGYQPLLQEQDLTAPEMAAAYKAPLDSDVLDGGRVVLYYSGHGGPTGLAGVNSGREEGGGGADPATNFRDDDLLPASELLGIARSMQAKGADVHVIVDACFGGGLETELVAQQSAKADLPTLNKVADGLRAFVAAFGDHNSGISADLRAEKARVSKAVDALDAESDAVGKDQVLDFEARFARIQAISEEKENLLNDYDAFWTDRHTAWWDTAWPELAALNEAWKASTGGTLPLPPAKLVNRDSYMTAIKQVGALLAVVSGEVAGR